MPDLCDQRRHARLEVDQYIRLRDQIGNQSEDAHIGIEIPSRHESHPMQVVGKDIGILIHRTVLHDIAGRIVQDIHRLLDATSQKIDLEIKRPAIHILIKITDIRIVTHLVIGLGPITFGQHLRQRRLAASDISCNCDIHWFLVEFSLLNLSPVSTAPFEAVVQLRYGRSASEAVYSSPGPVAI